MASNTFSSPISIAPAALAARAALESGGQMTQIRVSVFTACGSRRRLRMTGPFLSVRSLTATSYLEEVGSRPTSKARMYLV